MPPPNVYTVSQVTAYIKSRFAEDVLLSDVWLSGEVSNFKQHSSGHCYFTLKDATSSIKGVIWRTAAARMVLPREGDAVVAHGYISVYEPQGVYQIYVDHLEPKGLGRLWVEFERLKARLEAQGLFDADAKRPLVPVPARLGVVTSSTGAALRDILRTLEGRLPLVEVVLAPTLVQGETAPPRIVAAIEALNRWSAEQQHLDAIIVARGGGSIEELWAFNDERVARAIRASSVPVITGIGHETDFTIADFAADVRAPTPTGAAMLAATTSVRELREALNAMAGAARTQMTSRLAGTRTNMDSLAARLARVSPAARLAGDRQGVEELSRRSDLAMANRLEKLRGRLAGQRLRVAALDPAGVLARGYAIVTTAEGIIVTSKASVHSGDPIQVRVADGSFGAEVINDGY
jgi:exodeoxyribonuclease VII large subunit